MLPMDCHTHTGISPDGSGTVAGHIAQAEKLELPVLALTEHVEMNRYFPQAHYGTEPRNEWEIFDHAAVLEQSLEVVTAAKEQAARQWSDPALRHGNGAAQRRLWAFRICEPGYAAGFHYCIAPRTIG